MTIVPLFSGSITAVNATYTDPPDPWLAYCTPALGACPGPVIDLACGAGRNALWLARRGHRAVGVDESPERIGAATERAFRQGLEVDFKIQRVTAGTFPPGPWGGVCVVHFLDRLLFPALETALTPGGWLLYKTHLAHPLREPHRRPRNPAYLLNPGELWAAFPRLTPVAYREWADRSGTWAGLLARRPATPRTPPPG